MEIQKIHVHINKRQSLWRVKRITGRVSARREIALRFGVSVMSRRWRRLAVKSQRRLRLLDCPRKSRDESIRRRNNDVIVVVMVIVIVMVCVRRYAQRITR